MMLDYGEMTLFLRAGFDMSRPTFAPGSFLRYAGGKITVQHADGSVTAYKPTRDDRNATNWRRA